MDFPIKNGGSFHSYVKLPEGKWPLSIAMLNCQRVYDKELKYWCLMCIFKYIHRTDTGVNVYNCKCGTQTYALRCRLHTIAHAPAWSLRVCIVTSIWVNYNDLTATSLESWLIREIIPKWPNNSGSWNTIIYPAASMRMSKCTVLTSFCFVTLWWTNIAMENHHV